MRKKSSPLQAIRAKCLDCSSYQPKEVRKCNCSECPLYVYRMGKNPNRRHIGPGWVTSTKKPLESADFTKERALND